MKKTFQRTNPGWLLLLALFSAGLLAGIFPLATLAADKPALKYGLYIHFGTATFANPGEQGQIPAERFAPAAPDVKQWAHAAKEAGMTFAVLTAKHESGFCLWDSVDYDYDIAHSPVKTDIIADFIAACNAEGITPGVHYSIPDAYNEGVARGKGPVPPPYFNVIKKHVTELHTKYPGIRVQIFDGSQRLSTSQWEELSQLIHRLNPACTLLDWTHPPIYGTQTVIKSWMWTQNGSLNTPEFLFKAYSSSMRQGAAWLGNVGVDRTGKIPANQIAVLMRLKNLIANPPPATSATAAPETKPDAAERLKKVKALYDQGLINKDDYDKKVKEIMDSL